jgi:hypothetical protein
LRKKIRPLILGKDGAGKSWMVATFPKKMLVFLTDAPDKADAYLRRGIPGEIEKGQFCYFQNVFSEKDPEKLIIRVEYWGESNPDNPTSYGRFISRTANLESEITAESYQSVVLDSATAFELMARYYSENNINKGVKDGRQHYAFSSHAAEQFIMTRWPNLIATNAVVIGHYDEQKDESDDGEKVVVKSMIALPGKLPNRIGSQYSEVWRVYIDSAGNRVLQTSPRPGNSFACKTSVGFKDGIFPHYESIWQSVEEEKKDGENGTAK